MTKCVVCKRRFKLGEQRYPVYICHKDNVGYKDAHFACQLIIRDREKLIELENILKSHIEKQEQEIRIKLEEALKELMKTDW